MELRRTANAGVLLTLDGVSILLDGVCGEVPPYLATPDTLRAALLACPADAVAFTHDHADHFDRTFGEQFQKKTLRPVFGPESLPLEKVVSVQQQVGSVTVIPIPSKHLGRAGQNCKHVSFILQGSRCVWFLGDASPLQWKLRLDLPKPDMILVPFAYAASPSAWQITKDLGAKQIILLHMPLRGNDPAGLWDAVEQTVGRDSGAKVLVPEIGEIIRFRYS